MHGRWASSPLIFTALRIETYPGGPPFKGLHKVVLAVLLERCDPADGKDGRARLRNRALAEASAAAELDEPHAQGATLASVPELARQAGVAEKVARDALQAFKGAGWVRAYSRTGRRDLLVVDDAALLKADPRSPVANTAPVADLLPVANATPVAETEPVPEMPPDRLQICPHPGGTSDTTPHDHDARADFPDRPFPALNEPPVAPMGGDEEGRKRGAIRRLSDAWGDGCGRARRTRGVLGVNGAEAETLRRLVDAYPEQEVAEAIRREILRAGHDTRGPRLDWVEDALRGSRPPSHPPAARGPVRTRAGAVPGAARWARPDARGEDG